MLRGNFPFLPVDVVVCSCDLEPGKPPWEHEGCQAKRLSQQAEGGPVERQRNLGPRCCVCSTTLTSPGAAAFGGLFLYEMDYFLMV